MNYPRILIISINALNKAGSNGKVLSEFFSGWDKNALAQLYMYNEYPDFEVCNNFFRITDKEALMAFKTGKVVGRKIEAGDNCDSKEDLTPKISHRPNRNPLTCLLRDIVWNSNRWRSKKYWDWIKGFNPELVFLMAGASSFIHKIAIDVANHCDVPLVVYNTENYYFKNYNYLKGRGWSWLFPIYKAECDKMFRRLMARSECEIYNNEELDYLYSNEFGRHGKVIYQASNLSPLSNPNNTIPIFSYAGNLGINRHEALIEIGDALHQISPDYHLDVYGRATPDVEKQLDAAAGIKYHGLVTYQEVIEVMEKSDFMIHAESFTPFWVKDLSTAFSTKLSDILSAGKCLILYADSSLACSNYVKKNNCGCLITEQKLLKKQLVELINSSETQDLYRKNALIAAKRDMDGKKNCAEIHRLLQDVIKKANK